MTVVTKDSGLYFETKAGEHMAIPRNGLCLTEAMLYPTEDGIYLAGPRGNGEEIQFEIYDRGEWIDPYDNPSSVDNIGFLTPSHDNQKSFWWSAFVPIGNLVRYRLNPDHNWTEAMLKGEYMMTQQEEETVVWEGAPLFSLMTRYRLTTQRLIIFKGWFRGRWGRTVDSLELFRIIDYDFHQGPFLHSFLGIGNVRLVTNDQSHPVLQLVAVSDPEKLQDLIRIKVDARKRELGMTYQEESNPL